jgi:hypothetical protein
LEVLDEFSDIGADDEYVLAAAGLLSEAFQLASTGGCATGLRTRSRHVCEYFPRLDHLARDQPQLLAVRLPRATGLAS